MAIATFQNLAAMLLLVALQINTGGDRVSAARITIQVHETITATSSSAAQVTRVVRYNAPFRELMIPYVAAETYWRAWLIPNDAHNATLSAVPAETIDALQVTARYDYSFVHSRDNFATTLELPVLTLPPAEPHFLTNYPLSLELDHYIEIRVPGFAVAPPAPAYRRWDSGSYLLVAPILKPPPRAESPAADTSVTQLYVERHYLLAQGDSAAWQVMNRTAPLSITYQAFQPGYSSLLGHLAVIAGAGIIALILFVFTVRNRYSPANYERTNSIFALFIMLCGVILLGICVYWWNNEGELGIYRALQHSPLGAIVSSALFALRTKSLPLIGAVLGSYFIYWSLAAFSRAAWTRWSGIALAVIGAAYITSLSIALLPFPELFIHQRLALTALPVLTIFSASVIAGTFLIADADRVRN